jgi:FdhD protein
LDNKTQKSKIFKWSNNDMGQEDDYVATEAPLEIRLGHSKDEFNTLAISMCSPSEVNDLVYGYLFTENIINTSSDVVEIKVFDNDLGLISEVLLDHSINYQKFINKRYGMVHASCGICGKTDFDDLLTFNYPVTNRAEGHIEPQIILSLPEKLKLKQQAFIQTGGLHASALFSDTGELLFINEDIGRHNALDKLIGTALRKGMLPLTKHIILLSGRVSFELVHKSLMAGVSTLCAIGAPSSLSIEIAQVNGLQLFGFSKASGFNRYTEKNHYV